MPLSPTTIANRRHLARIGVRIGAAGIGLYGVRELLGPLRGYSIVTMDVASVVAQVAGYSLVPAAWFAIAIGMVVCERWIVRWVVPTPRPGCPTCGYDISRLKSPVCPECGGDIRSGGGEMRGAGTGGAGGGGGSARGGSAAGGAGGGPLRG